MPLTCGVTVNLNNLKLNAQNQLNTFINLDLGTPDGLNAIAGQITGALSSLGSQIASVIPIPTIPLSLRDELSALAALPLAGVAAVGKILSIAEEFADAIGLQGFANLNLNDLSKSVFSLSTTFDPCNPSIPNILKGADGLLQKMPSIQPKLGETIAAVNNIKRQENPTNFISAFTDNLPITSDVDISSIAATISSSVSTATTEISSNVQAVTTALEKNVAPAVSGMGDAIRRLPSGQQVVETKEFFIKRIREERTSILTEV